MNAPLTKEEENVIKDIIKAIGNTPLPIQERWAEICGVSTVVEFDSVCESIFRKLGNGRVTQIK